MNRKILIIATLLLILILPISIVSAENLLEEGEIILDQRINLDSTKEIFTELDGHHYKKLIKDGQVIKVEEIQLNPTGLKLKAESKDKDIERALDNKLSQMGIYSTNLPSSLDHSDSQYLPPVGRQMEDSCVGWATGYYLRTYQQGMDLGWKIKDGQVGNEARIFSPSFIYNQINEGVDEGAYMEDAGDLLRGMGAATLEDFPYIAKDYLTQPDEGVIESAYPHRIRDWKIIYTPNDSREYIIQKTKEYLNTEDLLVAGIKVGFKFNDPWEDEYGNAIVSKENYANYGHAVTIVGYDDNLETPDGQGAFKIVNSYGKDWGNDGFAYLTYENYVTNIQAGYVFTDLVNEGPIDTEKEPIDNIVEEEVLFNIDLEGYGRYDIEIVNKFANKVYEEKNIQGKPGTNTISWKGLDLGAKSAPDGEYTIKLLGEEFKFTKEGHLNSAKTYLIKDDGKISSIEVDLSAKKPGSLDLYIKTKDKRIEIYKGIKLEAKEEYKYNIDISEYLDLKDIKDAKVLIEIR